MISAEAFCAQLDRRGVGLVAGVPGSSFGGVPDLLERRHDRYVPAANEEVAMAVGAGAELAGTRSAVLIQNPGRGLDKLTSMLLGFDVPLLVFVSLPDRPAAAPDVPGVPSRVLGPAESDLTGVLNAADQARAAGRPAFVLIPPSIML